MVYQGTAKQSQSWDSVGQPSFHGMHSSSQLDFFVVFFRSRGESKPKGLHFDTKILERVVDASDTMLPLFATLVGKGLRNP